MATVHSLVQDQLVRHVLNRSTPLQGHCRGALFGFRAVCQLVLRLAWACGLEAHSCAAWDRLHACHATADVQESVGEPDGMQDVDSSKGTRQRNIDCLCC